VYINLSYRTRGKETRAQTKKYSIKATPPRPIKENKGNPTSKVTVTTLIVIMFKYSLMNSMPNNPPLNSILTPETSSLSASPKSKGVRLSSIKMQHTHIIASGSWTPSVATPETSTMLNLDDPVMTKKVNKIKDKLISKDTT
jgi:hypothetical protein